MCPGRCLFFSAIAQLVELRPMRLCNHAPRGFEPHARLLLNLAAVQVPMSYCINIRRLTIRDCAPAANTLQEM